MRRQDATAALLFLALSVAMTWPLAWNLDRAVSDPGVEVSGQAVESGHYIPEQVPDDLVASIGEFFVR